MDESNIERYLKEMEEDAAQIKVLCDKIRVNAELVKNHMQNKDSVSTDSLKVIARYPLEGNSDVLVHKIDNYTGSVLASMTGIKAEWCPFTWRRTLGKDSSVAGFCFAKMFIPLEDLVKE